MCYPNCSFLEMWMPQILTASWLAVLPDGATPVGISRSTPRSSGYRRLRSLEPGPWFRSVTAARYLELYCEILDRLDPDEIYAQLSSFGAIAVMLCWESASDCHSGKAWCHRHLVAQWLEDRLGMEICEVGYPNLDRFAFLKKAGLRAPDYHDDSKE